MSIVLLSELIKEVLCLVFQRLVLKHLTMTAWEKITLKINFPIKSTQIFQENVSVVSKLTQLTVTPEKNYDAWLYIAYRNKIK